MDNGLWAIDNFCMNAIFVIKPAFESISYFDDMKVNKVKQNLIKENRFHFQLSILQLSIILSTYQISSTN